MRRYSLVPLTGSFGGTCDTVHRVFGLRLLNVMYSYVTGGAECNGDNVMYSYVAGGEECSGDNVM